MLIIGGIKLYRTFALYKEEKSFNVLKGTIPSFCSTIYRQEEKGSEENFLKGSTPTLDSILVPVVIDNCGKVHKADTNKKWYDYEKKMWANAVILNDNVKNNYQNGEIIPEENIESYFVWIPKYSYKLFDAKLGDYTTLTGGDKLTDEENIKVLKSYQDKGSTTIIDIKFGTTNTENNDTECMAPASGEDGSCKMGNYMTHPAFTSFGNINGFWVGKFETSRSDITSESKEISFNDEDSLYQEYANKVIIKPNEYSWRNIKIKDMFNVSYYYQRDLDSHMMKNTEWGAIAYLTNSIYGRCSENECSDVQINNNSAYMTGYSAVNAPTTGKMSSSISCENSPEACNEYCAPSSLGEDSECNYNYMNDKSVLSSTTGNYYGIYDMSGGTWEWTMAFAPNNEEKLAVTNTLLSDFKLLDNLEDSKKYYDVYIRSKSSNIYSNRILGDATGEMGPFYKFKQPSSSSSQSVSSWYHDVAATFGGGDAQSIRSGSFQNGNEAGIYYFNKSGNIDIGNYTFRITLAF